MNRIKILFSIIAVFMVVLSGNASAHAPRESYVWTNIELDHLSGRVELNVNDIKNKLGVDVLGNDENQSALKRTEKTIQQYLEANLKFSDSSGEIPYSFTHSDMSTDATEFAQYFYKSIRLPDSESLQIENTIFLTDEYASSDPLHRSLVVLEYNKAEDLDFGKDTPFLVFGPTRSIGSLNTIDPEPILEWKAFFVQGILHIWKGIDHVLFVVILLLTTVLRSDNKKWLPIQSFGGAFLNTLKIVTVFTIAHSITLALAAFGYLEFNSGVIESIIALSIIAMAVNNIFPRFTQHTWLLVFIFGLFHGLGFATVMSDLQFRTGLLTHILIMFNVGVEVGQFAIVLLIFPLLYWIRTSSSYHRFVVVPVSVLGIVVAAVWFMQRTGVSSYVT